MHKKVLMSQTGIGGLGLSIESQGNDDMSRFICTQG